MHQEKYTLTWHTYSDHLKSMMKELMMNEDYSDVTLVTEDKKQIKANISILSACSPVFKDILKEEKNSSTMMYLRGIQYSEMESILQFIYLGEATFYEERMDEFLAVAKSLEIKELRNAEKETNAEPVEEPLTTDSEIYTENFKEQTIVSDEAPQEGQRNVVDVKGTYECEPCEKTYVNRIGLLTHKQTDHQGVKYACDQCDFQTTQQGHLTVHKQSKHEAGKYACNRCDKKFTLQSSLIRHIKSQHKIVRYACNQCDYQAKLQCYLHQHIKLKHQSKSTPEKIQS